MSSHSLVASRERSKGIVFVITAASLWGISGSAAQFLFQNQGFNTEWLVSIRMLLSGLLMLIFHYSKDKQHFFDIWKDKKDRRSLVIFGIFGMLGVQYTYFAAITAGNAATATLLQYMSPVIITLYLSVRTKRLPTFQESLAVLLALVGTFFLVTKGKGMQLSISQGALFWGILSAFASAFYTLHPYRLIVKWGSIPIVGWGMLIGGIGLSFLHSPFQFAGQWSMGAVVAFLFIILFGTLLAFYMYLESLKYILASEASVLGSFEPLSAAFVSVVWLNLSFGITEWIGMICIISTILILSVGKKS
ncbi:DMT family transporter [Ectobacillus polymachus]|uniref:DMT family transporter n=1 Tax=Ectobacillus polymachus TaxID=1508806 RepID=UPI003A8C4E04